MLIIHFRLQDLTDDQIADIMHLTPATIRQHISRLRRRIYQQPSLRPLLAGRRYRSPQ